MITVEHLTKCYGDFMAVSDLSFEIEEGHVYGFLGPNGAGKSTTMNIMTGCLSATDGTVRIDGYDIFEEPQMAKKLIGYLPEQPPLYMNETPVEYLKFVGAAKGLKGMELARQVEEVIDQTKIGSVRNKLISALSKGYKQRVGIAQALLGNPKVIILDEPTVGLDPIQIIEIRDLIRQLGESHTVILSSHILSEVQAICEKVLIIARGRLVAFDAPENLEKLRQSSNGIDFAVEALPEEAEEILKKMAVYEEYTLDEVETGLLRIHVKAGTDDIRSECRQLFFAFAEKQKAIVEMVSKKANLEDVFIELTEGEANGGLEGGEETDTVGGMGVSQGTAVNSLYVTEDIPDGVDAEDALEESEVEKG
jgi:ABC-2 type transport system ATP-binding protein